MWQNHRSFALTKPEYMRGKRVKRRLLLVTYASYLIVIIAMFLLSIELFLVILGWGGFPGGLWGTILLVGVLLVPHLFTHLILIALKRPFLSLGFLTLDEAKSFPPGSLRCWPESWLESLPTSSGESGDAHRY